MPIFRAAGASAFVEAGETEEARAEVERLTANDLAALPRDPAWSLSLAFLALACHHLDDRERAGRLHRLLEPYGDRHIATGRFGAFYLGPAAYFLGLLDLTLRRPEQAADLLEEAVAIAERLGIRGLGERAGGLRAAAIPAAPAWPAGLTGREVEVLRLIAAGRSKRAIAEALFISPNTVLHHVSNIFTKTGAANRAEAAAYATRHGLAS
jgi:DNA-binding CsgD family transcriptional regulator